MAETLVTPSSLADKVDAALAQFSTMNYSHQQFLIDMARSSRQRLTQIFDDLTSALSTMRKMLEALPEDAEFERILKLWTPELQQAHPAEFRKLCLLASTAPVFKDDLARLVRRINGETRINPLQRLIERPKRPNLCSHEH